MKEVLEMTDEEFVNFHKSHKGHQITFIEEKMKFSCECGHIFSIWDIWCDIPKRLKELRMNPTTQKKEVGGE